MLLNLELEDLRVEGALSAVDACASLLEITGGDPFALIFKGRSVPISMFRTTTTTTTPGPVSFGFNLAYKSRRKTGTKPPQSLGLNMTVGHFGGPTPFANANGAYLKSIRALPVHHWLGTDMIELALSIARNLGVRVVREGMICLSSCS